MCKEGLRHKAVRGSSQCNILVCATTPPAKLPTAPLNAAPSNSTPPGPTHGNTAAPAHPACIHVAPGACSASSRVREIPLPPQSFSLLSPATRVGSSPPKRGQTKRPASRPAKIQCRLDPPSTNGRQPRRLSTSTTPPGRITPCFPYRFSPGRPRPGAAGAPRRLRPCAYHPWAHLRPAPSRRRRPCARPACGAPHDPWVRARGPSWDPRHAPLHPPAQGVRGRADLGAGAGGRPDATPLQSPGTRPPSGSTPWTAACPWSGWEAAWCRALPSCTARPPPGRTARPCPARGPSLPRGRAPPSWRGRRQRGVRRT